MNGRGWWGVRWGVRVDTSWHDNCNEERTEVCRDRRYGVASVLHVWCWLGSGGGTHLPTAARDAHEALELTQTSDLGADVLGAVEAFQRVVYSSAVGRFHRWRPQRGWLGVVTAKVTAPATTAITP